MTPMVAAALALTSPILNPRCRYDEPPRAGEWGGECTCPDGSVHWAGAVGDDCESLACYGGTSGACFRSAGNWSNLAVDCRAEPTRAELPPELPHCKRTVTVAYAFLTRDTINWGVWHPWFASCPRGSSVPIIHSQDVSDANRAELMAELARWGGQLVPVEDTKQGDPRYSFLMMAMQFALYRVAGNLRAPNGCAPQFVHLLSESDMPTSTCAMAHSFLGLHPGVSRMSLVGNEGPSMVYEGGAVAAEIAPLGKTSQWSTLAMSHAAALADDECLLVQKWRPHMVHPDWDWPYAAKGIWRGIGVTTLAPPTPPPPSLLGLLIGDSGEGEPEPQPPEAINLFGSSEEFMFYSELAQRGFPFKIKRATGLTAVYANVKNLDSPWDHPLTFETYGEIVGGCEMSRMPYADLPQGELYDSWDYDSSISNAVMTGEGLVQESHFFFFRKVKGKPDVVAEAISACAGLSNRSLHAP